MVVGSSAHWQPPRSQALSRGPAPSSLAHQASKYSVTLLAPSHDGAGGNLGSTASRVPLAPSEQHLGTPLPRLNKGRVSSSTTPATIDKAPEDTAGRNPNVSQTGSQCRAEDSLASTSGRARGPRPASWDSPDPAVLTSWIKSSRNIARLQRLVRQHGSQMNHIHVSAALTHLSQLTADDDAAAAVLSAVASTSLPTIRGLDLSPPGSTQDIFPVSSSRPSRQDIYTQSLEGSKSKGFSTASTGGVVHDNSNNARSAAVGAEATSFPRCSSGCADLGSQADAQELLTSLLTLLYKQLPYFEARQLANTAWALGKWPAGLAGRDDALAAVLDASAPLLSRFGAQELSNLLHGWASCAVSSRPGGGGCTTSGPALKCDRVPTKAQGFSKLQPQRFLTQHSRECLSQLRRGRFKMQELSNLLWSWGVLLGTGGAGSGPYAWAAHVEQPRREDTAGDGPPAARTVAVPYRELLAAQLQLDLASAGPQELANSMLSLARLQLLPPPEWYEAFLLASRRHLLAEIGIETAGRRRNGAGACTITAAAAGSSMDPRASSRGSATLPSRTGFSPQELSNLLWGCSKLHLRLPPTYLDDVALALERCLPLMTLPERVNVLWALAWQAKLNTGDWGSLWDAAAAHQAAITAFTPCWETKGRGGLRSGLGGSTQWDAENDRLTDAKSEREGTEWLQVRDPSTKAIETDKERGQETPTSFVDSTFQVASRGTGVVGSRDSKPGALGQMDGLDATPSRQVAPEISGISIGPARECVTANTSGIVDGEQLLLGLPSATPSPSSSSQQEPVISLTMKADRGSAVAAGSQARRVDEHQPQTGTVKADCEIALAEPKQLKQYQQQAFPLYPSQADIGAAQRNGVEVQHLAPMPITTHRTIPLVRRLVVAVLDPLECTSDATAPQDVSVTLWSIATLAAATGSCRGSLATGGSGIYISASRSISTDDDGNHASDHDANGIADGSPTAASSATTTVTSSLLATRDVDVLMRLWNHLLEDMSPQGQANCVWAAARLQLRLPIKLQGRLASWLSRRAQDLTPAESAAVLRGLGLLSSQLRPSSELARATQALLEQAYLRHGCYGLCELAQVCYGGAMLLRCLGGSGGAKVLSAFEADFFVQQQHAKLPAASAIRMSIDLEEACMLWPPVGVAASLNLSTNASSGGSLSTVAAAAAAVAAAAQLRRLVQPLDALLGRLQQAYQKGEGKRGFVVTTPIDGQSLGGDGGKITSVAAAAGTPRNESAPDSPPPFRLEVFVMTLEAAAVVLAMHGSSVRGSELSAWCQDLVRLHARRALTQAPHHVRTLAPLLYAIAASAASSVRASRARKQTERERRRTAAARPGTMLARSSIDEFARSGRLAERREELMQLRQTKEKVDVVQQQHNHPRTRAQTQQSPPQTQPQQACPQQQWQKAQPQASGPSPQSATYAASGLSADWLQRFWIASAPSLEDATPKEAAMMLWAISSLAVQPPDLWVRTLLDFMEPHLRAVATSPGDGHHSVSDQTLGVLLSSLGHLRVRPSPKWRAAALAAVDTWATGGAISNDCSGRWEMDPAAVLGVLCGLACLEWPLPADWIARVIRAVTPQLGHMTPTQRTRAYMAVASLDAGLADRVGFEFSELLAAARAGKGPDAGAWAAGAAERERGEGATPQQRTLFTRSRAGF